MNFICHYIIISSKPINKDIITDVLKEGFTITTTIEFDND